MINDKKTPIHQDCSSGYDSDGIISSTNKTINDLTTQLQDNQSIKLVKEYDFDGIVVYICEKSVSGKIKYGVIFAGERLTNDDFIYDCVNNVQYQNLRIFIKVGISQKQGWLELGGKNGNSNQVIFDYVDNDLYNFGGKIFYKARLGNSVGWIMVGKENDYKKHLIYEKVSELKTDSLGVITCNGKFSQKFFTLFEHGLF